MWNKIVLFYTTFQNKREITSKYIVRPFSQCKGDTEIYCHTCEHDLCTRCKEKHITDIDTLTHDVVIHCEKSKYQLIEEPCIKHRNKKYEKFCDDCSIALCKRCRGHRTHHLFDLRTAYLRERERYREIVHKIRSQTIYSSQVFLAGIKSDMKSCPTEIPSYQWKVKKVKDFMETALSEKIQHIHYIHLQLKSLARQASKLLEKRIGFLEKLEHNCEQFTCRLTQYLMFIKKIKNIPTICVKLPFPPSPFLTN